MTICPWAQSPEIMTTYHDEVWGVPVYDDGELFAKLVLDGFQAGLSWLIVLRKAQAFKKAFDGFNPHKVALYDEKDVTRLLSDAGIIRHRGKIEATISNAQAYCRLQDAGESFADFLWSHVDGTPQQNAFKSLQDVPAKTAMSEKLSRNLKQRGFRFCGPTIVYAFAQAVGMVNDHIVTCPRYKACARHL